MATNKEAAKYIIRRRMKGSIGNFLKGMGTVGQLSPPPYSYKDYPPQGSAWQGVAASFCQAGDSLRYAMKKFPAPKSGSGQATLDE